MKTITILANGEVQFLGDDPGIDLPLGKIRRLRVSTIQPLYLWKRLAFLTVRHVCGSYGRGAAFTRTWAGPWRCVILATGQSAVFEERQAALDWEHEVLTGPKFEL